MSKPILVIKVDHCKTNAQELFVRLSRNHDDLALVRGLVKDAYFGAVERVLQALLDNIDQAGWMLAYEGLGKAEDEEDKDNG